MIFSKTHGAKAPVVQPQSIHDFELPDGLYLQLQAECRSCGRIYDFEGEAEQYDPQYSYCGGSPRCIP